MSEAFSNPPAGGSWISYTPEGTLSVPDDPIVGFIEGDGVGPDIWAASRPVFDAAVNKASNGTGRICWREISAGEKSFRDCGEYLPAKSVEDIKRTKVVIKGPLTTPVGKGYRSVNVTLRRILDLYACIRPVRYVPGAPSPVKSPELVNMVIFRENTEDVYAGIEWKSGTPEAERVIKFLREEMGTTVNPLSGIGIKPMSPGATKRLVRRAILYTLEQGMNRVTLVHKGNIMKFTEGAFRDWGYELAREEFAGQMVVESELESAGGVVPPGKFLINDRIADSMFQQALLRPEEYQVLALPNLNGDYLSDALAAQVGGLGMAPGANVGDTAAVFEATHGSAPKYAGLDKVNPGSLLLSGAMMFDHMGWKAAADLIRNALARTVQAGTVTYDLARRMPKAREVSCSAFGEAVIENM
ncbi:MAG: isocitrate dehydrogenase (NADP(+)) [Pseudomonadota bacterium]